MSFLIDFVVVMLMMIIKMIMQTTIHFIMNMTMLLMLSVLSILPSIAQGQRFFFKAFKPCHVGIHWIAHAEYSQISTHVPGFQ